MADVIAIQQVTVIAALHQALFQAVGQRRFSRTGQAGQPNHARLLSLLIGPLQLGHFVIVPHHIARLIHHRLDDRPHDHARADRGVGQTVDDDKTAGAGDFVVGIKGNGLIEGEAAISDLVQAQFIDALVLQGVDVDAMMQQAGNGGNHARAHF